MAKYAVKVLYHKAYEKELSIFAKDEERAEEKALEIVDNWDDVVSSEIVEIMEE